MSNGKIIKLDQQIIDTYDNDTRKYYLLTEREAIILLSQITYISWATRWANRTYTQDDLFNITASIADWLMNPMNIEIVNCEDVENCLTTSPTIVSVNNAIGVNASEISQTTQDLSETSQTVQEIVKQSPYNIYPPAPEETTQPDAFCGTAWYIAEQLNVIIQDVITDAQVITFQEFMIGFVGLGGFDTLLVKQLWDYINALSNPNLSSDVSTTISNVAEAFYCSNLNTEGAISLIEADTGITTDAQNSWVRVIRSLTVAKYSELIYLGSLDTSRDCSGFVCAPDTWCYTFDFTVSDGGWVQYDFSSNSGFQGYGNHVAGIGWESEQPGNRQLLGIKINIPETIVRTVAPVGIPNAYLLNSGGAFTPFTGAVSYSGSELTTEIRLYTNPVTSTTQTLTSVTLTGEGVNPFGNDNC